MKQTDYKSFSRRTKTRCAFRNCPRQISDVISLSPSYSVLRRCPRKLSNQRRRQRPTMPYVLPRLTFGTLHCLVPKTCESGATWMIGNNGVTQVANQKASLPVLKERRSKKCRTGSALRFQEHSINYNYMKDNFECFKNAGEWIFT